MSFDNTYVFKVLYALDVFASSLLWRDSCITISARCGLELRKASPSPWARALGGLLNWISTNHCENAILHDRQRAQAAVAALSTVP